MFDYVEIKQQLLEWIQPEDPTGHVQSVANGLEHGEYGIHRHKLDTILEEAHKVFVRTGVSSVLTVG